MKPFAGIRNLFRIMRTLRKIGYARWPFETVEKIFEFVEQVGVEQHPRMTRIIIVNTKTGKEVNDFVSLWAGVGGSNPINRSDQMKGQRDLCKEALKGIYIEFALKMNEHDKKIVEFAIQNCDAEPVQDHSGQDLIDYPPIIDKFKTT